MSPHAVCLSLLTVQAACVVMLLHVLTLLSLEARVTSHLLYPGLDSKAQCFVVEVADDVKKAASLHLLKVRQDVATV